MRSAADAEPPIDPGQSLSPGQLRRVAQLHAVVFGFYAVDGVLMTVLGALGTLPPAFGLAYTAVGWCAAGLAVRAFRRSGRGRRDLDRNNIVMSLGAATQMLATAWLAPPVGALMLMSLMTVLAASALQLAPRTLLRVWLAFACGTVLTLLTVAGTLALPTATPAHRLVTAAWFAWLLGKCALINVEGTRLRQQAGDANTRLKQALGDLVKVAATDELTVIPNRRSIVSDLHAALDSERGRADRIAVALFDIDHFKLVNDRFGHATGDVVLREFASLVSRSLRPADRVGRYGGEEFLLVLEQVKTAAAARETADRMRRSVEDFDWGRVVPGLRVTASAGVALIGSDESAASAVARADRALYAAKAGGRNRVALADGTVPSPAEAPALPAVH